MVDARGAGTCARLHAKRRAMISPSGSELPPASGAFAASVAAGDQRAGRLVDHDGLSAVHRREEKSTSLMAIHCHRLRVSSEENARLEFETVIATYNHLDAILNTGSGLFLTASVAGLALLAQASGRTSQEQVMATGLSAGSLD